MAKDIPPTMRAARLHRNGQSNELRLETVATPRAEGDDVLVEIKTAGINPLDWKIIAGDRPAPASMILGHDLVGRVVATGPGAADRFALGELVYAMANEGAFAEYAAVPATALASVPRDLSGSKAAAVPMGALTAWKGLFDIAGLKKEERVLIHGAGGNVGGAAAQLARHAGAWVAASATGDDLARLRSWGVDLVIDYKSEAFDAVVAKAGGVDVVFDVLGGETRDRSWAVLRDRGRMASTLGATEPSADAAARGVKGCPAWGTTPNGARLEEVTGLFDQGALTVAEPKQFSLVRIAEAVDAAEHGHVGKVVIVIADVA